MKNFWKVMRVMSTVMAMVETWPRAAEAFKGACKGHPELTPYYNLGLKLYNKLGKK